MKNVTSFPKTVTEIEAGHIVRSIKGSVFVVMGFTTHVSEEEYAMLSSYSPIHGKAPGTLALPLSILSVAYDLMI